MSKKLLIIVILAVFGAKPLYGQWTTLPGPYGGTVFNFFQSDSLIYASAINGIYISSDQGRTWKKNNLQLPNLIQNYEIILVKNNVIFLSVEIQQDSSLKKLYRSDSVTNSFQFVRGSCFDYSAVSIGDTIYLASHVNIDSLIRPPSLQKSYDLGRSWVDITPQRKSLYSLHTDGKNLFAIADDSLHYLEVLIRSFDYGRTWDTVKGVPFHDTTGYSTSGYYNLISLNSIAVLPSYNDTILYVATYGGALSTDMPILYSVTNRQDSLIGINIPQQKKPIYFHDLIQDMKNFGKNDFYVKARNHIYKYDFINSSWEDITYDINTYSDDWVSDYLPLSNQRMLVATGTYGSIYAKEENDTLYHLADSGLTSTGPIMITKFNNNIATLCKVYPKYLFISSDNGLSWTSLENPDTILNEFDNNHCVFQSPKGLLVGDKYGVMQRDTNGIWVQHYFGQTAYNFIQISNSIFCLTSGNYFRSDDYGNTWTSLNLKLPEISFSSGCVYKDRIIISYDSLRISNEAFNSWTKINNPNQSRGLFWTIASDDTAIFANYRTNADDNRIYKSIDGGITWTAITPDFGYYFFATKILFIGDKLLVGTRDGLFRCNKNGSNWTKIDLGMEPQGISDILIDSNYVYLAATGILKGKISDILNYVSSVSKPVNFTNITVIVYPNPASGNSVTVSMPSHIEGESFLYIYDVIGKEIYKKDILPGMSRIEIPINNLSEGVYFVKLVSESGVASQSFVKVK